MGTVIIDYGSGNLHSALKAFERASANADSGEVSLTSDPDLIRRADHIVLPGVGAFADCKAGLLSVPGMVEALNEVVIQRGRPFLGICVGMQLMASRGLEHHIAEGLDWITGDVVPITPDDPTLRIPHMGWNTLDVLRPHDLLRDIPTGNQGLHAYFVHSFQFVPANKDHVIAETQYGGSIVAIVGRDNLVGTQFHPEKSQKLGLALIANFLRWRP